MHCWNLYSFRQSFPGTYPWSFSLFQLKSASIFIPVVSCFILTYTFLSLLPWQRIPSVVYQVNLLSQLRFIFWSIRQSRIVVKSGGGYGVFTTCFQILKQPLYLLYDLGKLLNSLVLGFIIYKTHESRAVMIPILCLMKLNSRRLDWKYE